MISTSLVANIIVKIKNVMRGVEDVPPQTIIVNKPTICHPELVELFLSEERGKSKAPERRRDLA